MLKDKNNINYTTTESNRQDRERSKREDSICCNSCSKVNNLEEVLYNVHWEWCAFIPEDMMKECKNKDCDTLRSIIIEMRCSEHCG